MVRRGCLVLAFLYAGLIAAYFIFFTRYFEWPGNAIAAGFGGLFAAVGVGSIGQLVWARRDTTAFARAERRQAPADGQLVIAAGPIRPLAAPLTTPFTGQPCVAYEYEVYYLQADRRSRTSSRVHELSGFGMASSAIDTSFGAVRVLGFPLLDEFAQVTVSSPEGLARARAYAASTPFEPSHGLGKLKLVSALDDALSDADGVVRKDFKLTSEVVPLEERRLGERMVGVGEQVCALGLYDAEKRALVPSGATVNRLWPGRPAEVRRKIVGEARSQAMLGLCMFAFSHAALGLAFYLSETRHARESEADQASAIRSAVQENDVIALERAVRRGANPNARDAFGDTVLLDVREPEMVAALIRLGAAVDVRHPSDGDTPLIRAARMGNVEVVRLLLAAHANVQAEMTSGETALSEAIGFGHDEIASLLRAAGAKPPDDPAQTPPGDLERPRRPPP
jgi:hypothetical protein